MNDRVLIQCKYETRSLYRSNLFRVFFYTLFISLSIFYLFSHLAIQDNTGNRLFSYIRRFHGTTTLPSSIPATNVVLSTLFISALIVIQSVTLITKERMINACSVLHTRSYSNLSYILGKTLGITLPCILLVYLLLVPALIYNIFHPDISFEIYSYFIYPVLISIPTFIFLIGISFLISTVTNLRTIKFVCFMLLVVVVRLTFEAPSSSFLLIIPYQLPIITSSHVDLIDVPLLFRSRLAYLLIGLSLIAITSFQFVRLRESVFLGTVSIIVFFSGLGVGAGLLAYNYKYVRDSAQLRSQMLIQNRRLSHLPAISVTRYEFEITHAGDSIICDVDLQIINEGSEPVDSILFTLNPGFNIQSVNNSRGELCHTRRLHHIILLPQDPLLPKDADTITMKYGGCIDEATCYLYSSGQNRWDFQAKRYGLLSSASNRYAYITNNDVVLTPAVYWYPVPGVQFDPDNPIRQLVQFSRYTTTITVAHGLTPISQGVKKNLGNERYQFTPEIPLTGISLIIGRYSIYSMSVDSVLYSYCAYSRSDIVKKSFLPIKNDIGSLIEDTRNKAELDYGCDYPFRRFSLIEVPDDYTWHVNPFWTGDNPTAQPEFKLIQEDPFSSQGHYSNLYSIYDRYLRMVNKSEPSKSEVLRLLFERRISSCISHSFFSSFAFYFTSPDENIIGKAMDSYIDSRPVQSPTAYLDYHPSSTRSSEELSIFENASIALSNNNLHQIIYGNSHLSHKWGALEAKGLYLFYYLETLCGRDKFRATLTRLITNHRFSVISYRLFNKYIYEDLGVDFDSLYVNWYSTKKLPTISLKRISCEKSYIDNREMYTTTITFYNHKDVPGLILLSVSASGEKFSKYMILPGNQYQSAEYTLLSCPKRIGVEYLLSSNLPNRYSIDLNSDSWTDPIDNIENDAIIVDNEDPLFEVVQPPPKRSILTWLYKDTACNPAKYIRFRMNTLPRCWTPAARNIFYGQHLKTAYFCNAGRGEGFVRWNLNVTSSGWYDVYVFIPIRIRMKEEYARKFYDYPYNYQIFHDDGISEVPITIFHAAEGWNYLGRFYFSSGNGAVTLSNKSSHGPIIADAVKLIPIDHR